MAFTFENPNIFANYPLDRASHLRTDAIGLDRMAGDANAFVIPFWKLKPLALRGPHGKEAGFLAPGLAEAQQTPGSPRIFLGLDKKQRPYFAIDISAAGDPENKGPLAGMGAFEDLRVLAMQIPADDVAILGTARSLLDWHENHMFCAKCGQGTAALDGGFRRVCGDCNTEHFPRVNPVSIMLATSGDKCLVGRGKQFPPGMFSALAGFIEPGETIEEAVARELYEEAGVKVKSVTYYSCQPWPWPSQLMMGCFAEAESEDIKVDENELAEARWVDRATMKAVIAGKGPEGFWIPPKLAIAHMLIKAWTEQG
ncbi:MAG: NAD(+) diphosphatase [Alphaproteobacteria bacterium]|nr:NAD(+) diphosphatase [Alphaproteobacteria bacterium]